MPDKLLSRWRGIRNRRRKRAQVMRKALTALNVSIEKLNRTIAARKAKLETTPGEKAANYLLQFVGRTELPPGSNDGPFLAAWRAGLPSLKWMAGQPWCGLAVIAAYHFGAHKRLPDSYVYTPSIVNAAKNGDGLKVVKPEQAQKGDLVVFNFPGGSPTADHVGLALGPAVGGYLPTCEGNTSFDDSGSQSNGGAVAKRSRHVSLIAVVARPV